MDGFDEVIKEFLVESYESLDQLDSDLVALEETPDDLDRLASIFRTVHTIKGTSGFLALEKLEKVAHVGENLLVPLRDGELDMTADIADGLLAMVDSIREIFQCLESDGSEGETDFGPLVQKLKVLLENKGSLDDAAAPAPVAVAEAEGDVDTSPTEDETAEDAEAAAAESPNAEQTEQAESNEETTAVAPAPEAAPAKSAKPTKSAKTSGGASSSGASVADATVRIDVSLLDTLMNLVGELVLSRNQILQFCSASEDAMIVAASQRLNHITTELQEGVMKTRMQPIRNAWSKLPRVVRDLSSSCGKKVDVIMEGADTELDKTILEAIKDPLTHIVRNSVDHGIESPEERAAAGKPADGTLVLRAFHEGGQVNIEIVDDGGGINGERVRDKAVEKGLVTPEQAAAMTDREMTNLILLPGFSTAAKITNISGRGVGMDVVKTNIERIGGTLEIHSTAGKGTTLRIKIPLTLAIVPALIVRASGDAYAIPQVNLLELVRLEGDKARGQIEFIHDVPVYRLRGNLLPLVYLDEQLELREQREPSECSDSINIVVLRAEDRQFGLVVDGVTDTQEIVVKPLGQHLKSLPAYAGSTIMGDGTVALILDVLGLAQKSNVLTEHRDGTINKVVDSSTSDENEALLVVDADEGTRAAIRLSTVARLEEFPADKVERSGQNDVVQYRGEILPLITINGYGGAAGENNMLNTVVYSNGNQSVGVVVGKIVDIVDEPRVRDGEEQRIISDRVTKFLDLEQLVSQTMPEFATY